MGIPDFEKCKHPDCSKRVNNAQALCKEHRIKKCKHPSCLKKITKGLYCEKHGLSGRSPQSIEYMEEIT